MQQQAVGYRDLQEAVSCLLPLCLSIIDQAVGKNVFCQRRGQPVTHYIYSFA